MTNPTIPQSAISQILIQPIVEKRLVDHFSFHIGEQDSTSKSEIFLSVTGLTWANTEPLYRFFTWGLIHKNMLKIRREDTVFWAKRNGKYFVIKEKSEADYYKNVCSKAIKNMEKSKLRADDWVAKQKWRTLTGGTDDKRNSEPQS